MSLTKTAFYNYSGYSDSTVNGQAVDFFLSNFQEQIEERLGYVFSINQVQESDKFNYFKENTDYQSFITIGAWQAENLTIKKGSGSDSELSTLTSDVLVLGTDYYLYKFKTGLQKLPSTLNKDNPVVGVCLDCPLSGDDFLRIYGNWGYSNGLPDDLCMLIYTAVKNAIEYNDSTTNSFLAGGSGSGSGAISEIKEYTTQVKFETNDSILESARNYFLDFLSSPHAIRLLNRYMLKFNQTNYFI